MPKRKSKRKSKERVVVVHRQHHPRPNVVKVIRPGRPVVKVVRPRPPPRTTLVCNIL